jgi:hypothetical protein
MAIKGKSKSRSRRVVAVPPKPPVYVRKKPLFRRPWFLIAVAAVVIAGTLTGVFISIGNSNRDKLRQRTIAAVGAFAGRVEQGFPDPPASQPLPPTGYAMFPSLITDLDGVLQGSKDIDGKAKGQNLQDSARAAAEAIQAINVTKIIPLEADVTEAPGARGTGGTRPVMLEAQFLIVQAFGLYQNVGVLMERAARLPRGERTPLINDAKDLAAQAQTLFNRGYQKITTVRAYLEPQLPLNPFPQGDLGGG